LGLALGGFRRHHVVVRRQDEEIVNNADGSGGLVVLAVDDELPALEELEYLLGQDQRIGTILTASNANDALRMITTRERRRDGAAPLPIHPVSGVPLARSTDVDVVFADIRMPGLNGLEFADVLKKMAAPPAIVFVTAHDDKAVDAYEIGVVDYLLKPLRSARLRSAVDRVLSTRSAPASEGGQLDGGSGDDEVIPVELAGTTKLVPRSAVRYVEAQGDYARLHTNDNRSHLVRIPLSVLEERWRDAGFVRIHRSYLVALALVTELRANGSGYVVRLGNGPETAELPVSRRHTRELKDKLVRDPKHAWSQR
jgi:DNA-binding LytR/AlgR family response regulator